MNGLICSLSFVQPPQITHPQQVELSGCWRKKKKNFEKFLNFKKKKKKRRRKKKKEGTGCSEGREGGRKGSMPSRRRAATGGHGRGSKGGRYRGRAGKCSTWRKIGRRRTRTRRTRRRRSWHSFGSGDFASEKVGQRVTGSADLCIILLLRNARAILRAFGDLSRGGLLWHCRGGNQAAVYLGNRWIYGRLGLERADGQRHVSSDAILILPLLPSEVSRSMLHGSLSQKV